MVSFAVDTSVLVAILKAEQGCQFFEDALGKQEWIMGWPTVLELRIWQLRNPNFQGLGLLDMLLKDRIVIFADFNRELEALAADAYARFGKGRHAAKLNYGDCMTYAVATHHDVPLLFKGADFGLTDVKIHPSSVQVAS